VPGRPGTGGLNFYPREEFSMSILNYKGIEPQIAEKVFIAPGAWVIGDVTVGARSSIWFNTVVRGDEHYVRIGEETNVQDNSTLHVTSGDFPLEIGSRVTIGHRVVVHGCVVEDECLIGIGAVLLDGCRVGRGSMIAAGAVITPGTQIPPNSLVMGVPGKVAREVSEKDLEKIRHNAEHYLEVAANYLNADPWRNSSQVRGFLG
jgi:carbonic anhydrase/acetyltransferase-like protein (isoleucine patch superfamily)